MQHYVNFNIQCPVTCILLLQVSCGAFHSLLLTANGTVFSWGSNVHGQLGHPQVPELVCIQPDICKQHSQTFDVNHFISYELICAEAEFFTLIADLQHY